MIENNDYSYSSVIVGLKDEITPEQVNKGMFPDENIIDIENLNIRSPTNKKMRTILMLKLATNDKHSLFKSIAALKENPYVEYAELNHKMKIN